jgi:hypothetical protein
MQQLPNIDTCDLSHSPHCKFFQVLTDKNCPAGSRVPTSSTLLPQPCCCVVDVSCRVSCLADTAHKPPTGSQSQTHNLPPLPPCPLTQRWSDLASSNTRWFGWMEQPAFSFIVQFFSGCALIHPVVILSDFSTCFVSIFIIMHQLARDEYGTHEYIVQ